MRITPVVAAAALLVTLSACKQSVETESVKVTETVAEATEKASEKMSDTAEKVMETRSLADILAAQPDENKTRNKYRHPAKTLKYFGVKPGMTVAEVLPGGGWYSKILIPYLGDEGHLVGIDYSIPMWGDFGGFADEKFLESKKTWATEWSTKAEGWRDGTNTKISAFAFGSMPADLKGQVDVVFLPRAIHHLNRFEQAYLAESLNDMKAMLKPKGIVAIVAHRAAEDQPDGWASGDNGYMKQSKVIQIMDDAGFKLVGKPSEINANPKDQANAENEDKVWRLPPSLGTSRKDPELRAKMEAIGETDRMTLKFRLKK